jgi:hypothetical protein
MFFNFVSLGSANTSNKTYIELAQKCEKTEQNRLTHADDFLSASFALGQLFWQRPILPAQQATI